MATKETIDKVKSLLEGHCYGPLKEAAEKWLAVADEKYGDKFDELKEKAGDAYEKLEDLAEKYSDASIKANEKLAGVSDKIGDAYDKITEKAGPAMEKLGDAYDKVSEKAAPAKEKLLEVELVKQLKEGICTVGDLLDTFGSKDAAEKFGDEFASKMKDHANALKEKGEQFCDCEACRKARSILKDFGEDLDEKYGDKFDEIKDKAVDKFEELKAKADEALGEAKAEEPAEEPEEKAEEKAEE